ncbi:hypothetical protein AC579_173 [Pseudocercospora musae]|uniref:Uncharacterized protein n=1 Tax=Pseudocercospora musae TaxID=113226 RepID=A0A139I175_9PEZI|nr:hypothetical protein AC579_173 [Pseudocercospora musae]
MAPTLRPLAHRRPNTSHINHDPYPRHARMPQQPSPKGLVPLSTPFRLDRLSPLLSCQPRPAEHPAHRSSLTPRSRYSTPIADSAYMSRRSAETEVSESEETEEKLEEEEEEEEKEKERGCPWWCACLLLLLGAILALGLWRVLAVVKPRSWQPPKHPQSNPMDQCFRAQVDMADAPRLLPRGLRAPLSAMLVTLARDPDSASAWLQSAPMPFAPPVLPDSPEYIKLQGTRNRMHKSILSEYGHGFHPDVSPLIAWWKRLQAPAIMTTPSAGQVAAVERLGPSRLRRWACTWLPNDLTDQYLHLPCAAQAYADSPLKALDVLLNMTTLARNSCTPGKQSAADPMAVAQTMAAAESVQQLVLEQVGRIAERESNILHYELEDSNRVSWTDPTLHAAPWYPLGKGSRNGVSWNTMLSSTPQISSTAVPSESSERELNALAAVFAEATWFQLTGAIIQVINDLVTAECRQISSHATRIEEEGVEELVAAFRRPNASLSSSQLHQLAMSLLRLGLKVLIEEEQPPQADAKYYTLLEPLIDENGVFNEHLYSGAEDEWTFDDDGFPIKRTWRGHGDDAESRYSRTALEKMWKGVVLGFGRNWGKERTSSQPETWQTCLRDIAGTASFHRDGPLIANADGDIGLGQRLAHEAVWTFWHTGASPLWFTNAHRAKDNGNGGGVTKFDHENPDSWSSEGKLYREDLRVSSQAGVFMKASDVDMDLVWAWGRQ